MDVVRDSGLWGCLCYRLLKRWVLRTLTLVCWSWWVEALVGVSGCLFELWSFLSFREVVPFISVINFLAIELFISLPYYSYNICGINSDGPSLIWVFSSLLSLFLVNLARDLPAFSFVDFLCYFLLVNFVDLCFSFYDFFFVLLSLSLNCSSSVSSSRSLDHWCFFFSNIWFNAIHFTLSTVFAKSHKFWQVVFLLT